MDQQLNSKLFPLLDNTTGWKGPASYYPRNASFHDTGTATGEVPPEVIQIPASMVVSAAAYRKFMNKNQLDDLVEYLLKHVDVKDIEALQQPAAQIKEVIHESPLPECIESAIQAAGQRLDGGTIIVWPISIPLEMLQGSEQYRGTPYLGVTGLNETIEAIKWWWASLFDAPAIFHRELYGKSHSDATITVAAQQVPGLPPGHHL